MIQLALDGTHIGADLRIGGDVALDQVAKPKAPAVVLLLLLHDRNKLAEGLAGGFACELLVARALKRALVDRAAIRCDEFLDGFFFSAADAADQI